MQLNSSIFFRVLWLKELFIRKNPSGLIPFVTIFLPLTIRKTNNILMVKLEKKGKERNIQPQKCSPLHRNKNCNRKQTRRKYETDRLVKWKPNQCGIIIHLLFFYHYIRVTFASTCKCVKYWVGLLLTFGQIQKRINNSWKLQVWQILRKLTAWCTFYIFVNVYDFHCVTHINGGTNAKSVSPSAVNLYRGLEIQFNVNKNMFSTFLGHTFNWGLLKTDSIQDDWCFTWKHIPKK